MLNNKRYLVLSIYLNEHFSSNLYVHGCYNSYDEAEESMKDIYHFKHGDGMYIVEVDKLINIMEPQVA